MNSGDTNRIVNMNPNIIHIQQIDLDRSAQNNFAINKESNDHNDNENSIKTVGIYFFLIYCQSIKIFKSHQKWKREEILFIIKIQRTIYH